MEQDSSVGVVLVGASNHPVADLLDGAGYALLARVPDAGDAVAVVAEARPDVVVVDLAAHPAALAAIAALTADLPHCAVLALAGSGDHVEVLAAVRAGATGYLVRSTSPAELVAAVRRTAAGDAVFSPGLAAVVLDASVPPAVSGAVLTEREADIVRLVVDGLTARQIASRLVLSPRTVENHVQHVLRKLQLPNRAALVRYAIEHGLA
jgi:DNA-binding NarL/FixJ family response regulator